jgi:hypothetical protein
MSVGVCLSIGCSSSDEPNLHDPRLLVGTWNVPANAPAGQKVVQALVYLDSRWVETRPIMGSGTWRIQDDRLVMMFGCSAPTPGNPYCQQVTVNFEVTDTQLKWIWSGGSSWIFDRAPSQP